MIPAPTFSLERLELRIVLSGSSFAQLTPEGTLLVNGTAADNEITVSFAVDQVVVAMDGANQQFPRSSVARLNIDAGAGNDVVVNKAKIRSTILGGAGNDVLIGGARDDTIDGNAGNDTINGEGGFDTFTGGKGRDLLEYGDRAEPFTYKLGLFSGSEGEERLVASLYIFNENEADTSSDFFELVGGSAFADRFEVTSFMNWTTSITLLGRAGSDSFGKTYDNQPLVEDGGEGGDQFFGFAASSQPPTLIGGLGDDVFWMVNQPALIDGSAGIDTIRCNRESVSEVVNLNRYTSVENAYGLLGVVYGTSGPNRIEESYEEPPGARPTLYGGEGDDTLIGGAGNDSLVGGNGLDLIQGGGGRDTLRGGAGNDTMSGSSGNDKLYGGEGNDRLSGGTGRDIIYGDQDNDRILALDHEVDTLYGGDGKDSATVDSTKKVKDIVHEIETLV
jgi:Ca2+-binding RTX toxin-like protein